MGIDVLVPVLGRPQNVQPLVESLRVTQADYALFFICSPLDMEQIDACRASGARTEIVEWEAGKGDFAKKINWAFGRTEAEWVFQGADDIRFHPGWDVTALKIAQRTGRRVIGTNDLHNPQVRRGMQATHTLFARSYITEHGGTLDGTGKVFCELYDHQWVDLEFCETAKRRGEWAFAKQSIVEHLHPHWGLAAEDSTYIKATRSTADDYRLYRKRMGSASDRRRQERHERNAAAREERMSRRVI